MVSWKKKNSVQFCLVFFQYTCTFLYILRFCLARQKNSFCLNAVWAINISWLICTSKSGTRKILRTIDNAAVRPKSINTMFTAIRSCRPPFCRKCNLAWPNEGRQMQILYERSVKLSPGVWGGGEGGKGCLVYSRPFKWGLKHTWWKKKL